MSVMSVQCRPLRLHINLLYYNYFRKPETFWTTTGLFPQEFIVAFQGLMNVEKIALQSCNSMLLVHKFRNISFNLIRHLVNINIFGFPVAHMSIARSVQNEPVDFEVIAEKGETSYLLYLEFLC